MASTVWRGYITFGLITIPVRLFRAARAERVGLRRLYRPSESPPANVDEGELTPEPILSRAAQRGPATSQGATATEFSQPYLSPVQQVSAQKGSEKAVPSESVVKGYEYEKDRFVVLEKEELKSLAPKTSPAMEIQEFVSLSDIDPVYFETSYYLTPEEAGEKAYALLYRSMQTSGLVAIAQFAMHGREHVVVLRPGKKGLLAHTMYFISEVRAEEEYKADTASVAQKELSLAETLIRSLAAPFEPEKYKDTYREHLESLIAAKVKGQPLVKAGPAVKSAEVVDIADALRRSLANLKKPAGSQATPATSKTRAARGNTTK